MCWGGVHSELVSQAIMRPCLVSGRIFSGGKSVLLWRPSLRSCKAWMDLIADSYPIGRAHMS